MLFHRWFVLGAVLAVAIAAASSSVQAQTTEFRWSSSGPIAGLNCVQVHEGRAPQEFTWWDNYLCTDRDIGMRYSSAGPIAGMRCTQIIEGAEPLEYTWRDNYLCLPPSSPLTLRWSSSGPIAGLTCVQMHEGRDPYSWHDNFLCWTEGRQRADMLTITRIQNIKPASGLDAAGQALFGAIGIAAGAIASGGVSLADLYNDAPIGVAVGQYLDRQFSGQDDLIVKIDGRTYLPTQGGYFPMQAGQVIHANIPASFARMAGMPSPCRTFSEPGAPAAKRIPAGGAGSSFRALRARLCGTAFPK